MIEAGFTQGRNLIMIGQVRVDYETELRGKVNSFQTDIRSKWKGMTGKFGKFLVSPVDEKKFRLGWIQN